MPPELCLRTLGCAIRARGRLGRRAGPGRAGRGGPASPPLRACLRQAQLVEAQRPLPTPGLWGVEPLRAQSGRFGLERWDRPWEFVVFFKRPLEFREKGGRVT